MNLHLQKKTSLERLLYVEYNYVSFNNYRTRLLINALFLILGSYFQSQRVQRVDRGPYDLSLFIFFKFHVIKIDTTSLITGIIKRANLNDAI